MQQFISSIKDDSLIEEDPNHNSNKFLKKYEEGMRSLEDIRQRKCMANGSMHRYQLQNDNNTESFSNKREGKYDRLKQLAKEVQKRESKIKFKPHN